MTRKSVSLRLAAAHLGQAGDWSGRGERGGWGWGRRGSKITARAWSKTISWAGPTRPRDPCPRYAPRHSSNSDKDSTDRAHQPSLSEGGMEKAITFQYTA